MQYAYSIYLAAVACQCAFICCMHIAYEEKRNYAFSEKLLYWRAFRSKTDWNGKLDGDF